MFPPRSLYLFLSAILSYILYSPAANAAPNITTPLGTFSGTSIIGMQVNQYLGIPYAVPPIGNLRLRRPVPLTPRSRVPQTYFSGPSCLQSDEYQAALEPFSEDCLYLSIYVPAVSNSSTKFPVLVWTHGGSQAVGGIAQYNASLLVQHSVSTGQPTIWVGANYRLNSFGFLASRELEAEGNINLGLRDQRLALQWIHNNIAAFNGDPNKVTIFGESAGARSVSMQLLANGGNPSGLFRAAIMESGAPSSFIFAQASARQPIYQDVLKRTSCSSLACLRSLPAEVLNNASTALLANGSFGQLPYGPVLDADFAPSPPSDLIRQGRFAKVPIISGNNMDEGTIFTPTNLNTEEEMEAFLTLTFALPGKSLPSQFISTLQQWYPDVPAMGSPFGTGADTFSLPARFKQGTAIYGDGVYQAPRRDFLRNAIRFNPKIWSYLFTDVTTNTDAPQLGVYHSIELEFIYGLIAVTPTAPPQARQLSVDMMNRWLAFANKLDPNVDGLTAWPNYQSRANGATLQIQSGNTTLLTDDYRQGQMDFINSQRSLLLH